MSTAPRQAGLLCLRRLAILPTAAAMLAARPGSSKASTIVVTTTAPGIVADGQCSLSEAIENANAGAAPRPDCAAGGPANTIELAPPGLLRARSPP